MAEWQGFGRAAAAFAALGLVGLAVAPAHAAPKSRAPAARVVAAAPLIPLPITCGAAVAAAPTPEKKGLGDKLKGAAKGQKAGVKLPDACVLARFQDPAFPAGDAASPGQPIAALLGGAGPVPAAWPAAQPALQELANQIALAGPRPDMRARVVIVADRMEDARAFFQGPAGADGVIVLTTGLLERLYGQAGAGVATQEALRFILAHQYAHLVLKQPQQLPKATSTYDQMAQALQLASLGISVVQNFGGDAGGDGAKARSSASVILAAGFVSDLEAAEPSRFRFPTLGGGADREADLLAADILVRKGADPGVGVQVLKAAWDANRAHQQASAARRDQAAKAQALAAQDLASLRTSLLQVKNAPFLMQKAQMMAAGYVAHLAMNKLEERREMVSVHLHEDAEARIDAVEAYLGAFYPDRAAAVAQTDAGRKPLPEFDFVRLRPEVEGHQAAERAEDALARGDVVGARAEIDPSLKSPVGTSPDVLQIASAVAIAEGRPEIAIRQLKTVLASGFKGPLVYQKLAVAWRMAGDDNSALVALSDGATAVGDVKPFIADRISIFKARGDFEGVAAVLHDCAALNDMALTMACQRAAAADPGEEKAKAGTIAASNPPRAAMARVDQPLPPAEPVKTTKAKRP
ncbi:MAG: M48 family metalloprotease [Caulobacterales bacterium]|nr:M48 family metalloprotease [Caulobacterales bacterium]